MATTKMVINSEGSDKEGSESGAEDRGVFEYFGWVYHLGVNSIGHEYCHLRFLFLRGKYVEMYKRDLHKNPGIKPIRKGVVGHTLMVEERGRKKVANGDLYVLRFYNRLDETKKGEIACATVGEARKWMEAFDQAKQQAEYELSRGGSSRLKLSVENELNLGHQPRVKRYAHGLRKLIRIGQGPELLLRQSSDLGRNIRPDGYFEAHGDVIEAHEWKCVCAVNGIRIFEDVADTKNGKSVLLKSVGIIEARSDSVFEVVLSLDRQHRYEWDMLTGDLELVDSLNGHYDVVCGTYDPKYLTRWNSKKDFVFSRQWFRDQDGAYVILQFPSIHKKRPPRSGYRRTKINPSTWEIRGLTAQDLIVTRRSARLQSKVPDANPKSGRRNEAVQIAALSEEETEDLSKKSASRGDEIGVPGDDAKAQDRFSTEKGLRDTEVRALQEGSTPNDASAAAISDKVSSSIAFNVPEQSKREEGEKSILEISIADQDLVSEDASAKEVSGITGLAPDQISQEKTRSSETEESNASTIQGDLVSEDASAPVISAEGLQSQQETVTNMETATESSENVESKNVADLGFQAIADDELCEQVYSELPSLGTLDEEMLGEIESGNGISDQELNNGSVETDQVVECTRDFKDNGIDNLGLQVVIKEDLYADGSGEIPSSLSEVWDFGMMKDSIQECLVPLDSEVLGEMEYGDEKSGKKSLKEPSQLDFYSTENEGLLHCKTHVAQSIGDPLDEKTVVSENKGLVLEQDADVELSVLPDGKKLGSGKFGQIVDGYDADPVATESSPLICDVGLLDEIPFSAAVPILSQVPNYLSPSRGLVSESRYQLNQNNVTPSRSSTKKKATPSQRSAIIMVLDENQGSGGTGLRKKSNSKVLKPAAEEKENRENYSGGLSLKSKSNSKVITSLVEEKDNKKSYSGGLSLRNKSYSKVITSVAEEMKNNNKNFEDSIQRALKNKSLRQLKKMFKEKLSVADNTGDSTNDVIKG